MTQDIKADIQTSVVTLTLTREHAGNMFDLPMIHEMTRPIHAAADHARCVMTTLTRRDLMPVMA
jgi:enoyl-CoA hydratase/carnithine racemase